MPRSWAERPLLIAMAFAPVVACAPGERDAAPAAEPDTPLTTPDTVIEQALAGTADALLAEDDRPREPGVAHDSVARRMLVNVQELDGTIVVRARYATDDNFTGAPLPGYEANRALLRREAADAIGRAQERLRADGYGLKVWDGYRPARATRAMVEWAERSGREDLLNGWIARRSRHNLGLAVDVTLIDLATGELLDMGTDFDTFTPEAHTRNATGEVARNRQRLVRALEREGFTNYFREWWHFDFRASDERRFDLPIR